MLGCSDSSKPARCRSAAMQCYPLVRIALSVRRIVIIVLLMPERVRIVSASVRMTAITVRMTAISFLMTTTKLLMGRSASAPGLQAADVVSVGVTLLELWVGCLWHGVKTEPGCAKERVVALQKARRPQQRNVQRSARGGCHAMCCHMGQAVQRSAHHGNESGEHDRDTTNLYTRLLRST